MANLTASAVLTEEEKDRILYHMGYGVVNVASLFTLGMPAMSEPLYIAASAVNHIKVSSIQLVREIVAVLDRIDRADVEDIDYIPAAELGELKLAPDRQDRIKEKRRDWAQRLSDVLIAPLNPYSDRFGGGGRLQRNFRVARAY